MSEIRWRLRRVSAGVLVARFRVYWLEVWPSGDWCASIPGGGWFHGDANGQSAGQRAVEDWVRQRTDVTS